MATRNSDVNLVIRAQNDAGRAINSVADSLEALFGDAKDANGGLGDLGRTLASLDKAFAAINSKADAAASAFQRQQSAIGESRQQLAAVEGQAEAAARALEKLRTAVVDEVLAGRDQSPLLRQIEQVEQAQAALNARAATLTSTIDVQASSLHKSETGLLGLSSTLFAVRDGQAEAEARIELTNQALREQAAAAERVSEVQQRINNLTGVNRPDATGSAARAADILLAADAEFRLAEARREGNSRLAERAALEATLERTTGAGRVRATDAGATFSALAERERLAEDVERTAKAERDLAAAANATNSALAERAQIEAALERNTGIGRGRAIDNGATVTALTELIDKEHQAALAAARMDLEVEQLRATLDPLAAIQSRYNDTLARFRELAAAGKIGADELAGAEQHLAEQANRARAALERGEHVGKAGLFGLRPHELQNLSYQVNDVFTQLASGTSLTQTLGQQGGQILQLFPRLTSAIVGAFTNPAFLAAAGVFAAIAVGLKQAGDEAERLRKFSGLVAGRGDLGAYDPKKLTDQAKALQRLGAAAADADKAVTSFIEQGLSSDAIEGLGRAAQETAERLGQSLPDAAQAAAEAFSAGFDAIAKFDEKLSFLTASEREHIQALFDSGNAEAARTEARLAYQRMEDGIAAKQRGPWADASRSLGKAWHELVDSIGDSLPIKATVTVLNELAGAVKGVGDAIADALGNDKAPTGAAAASSKISAVQAQIRKLREEIDGYESAIEKGSPISGTLNNLLTYSRRQLSSAEAELARLEKGAPDTVTDDPNGVAAKKRAERLDEINDEERLQSLRSRGQKGLSAADSARRVQLAGDAAFQNEMAATGDAIVATRLRELAVAKEQREVDKQNEAARKTARQEREREIRQFQSRVVGAEGGTGKNPYSTAKGYGQFTESTFLSQFNKVFPDRASTMSRDQILALRQNEQVARAIIDNYSRENARFLESFGAKVTAGNLYLAHFLGAGGAKAVLTAPGNRPVDQIIQRLPNAGAVLSGNQGYLRTNGGKGRYRTASELQAFIGNRVGDTGAPQSQGQAAISDLIEDNQRRQEQFNLAIRHGNEERQRGVDALRAEAGLYDEALLAERRRQAVADAELDLRQKVEDANKNLKPGETAVIVTPEQVAQAKELAGALFDAQHAREALDGRLDAAQRPLNNLEEQRDLLIQQRDLLESMGEFEAADDVRDQITALGGSIDEAYEKLIAFYQALSPTERVQLGIVDQAQLDNLITKLDLAREKSKEWGRILGISARDWASAISGNATRALTSFIERVASGRNVFGALGQSVREFAAGFISSIAQMIIQLAAFAAAVAILRALGVPIPASTFGGVGGGSVKAGVNHTGGIAGSAGGVQRMVPAAAFARAMRYHTGGIAGFKPNEVPAILEEGEEVLTKGDPRHRANGGAGGGREQPISVKNINLFDRAELAAEMLSSKEGQRAVLNIVSKNKRALQGG
ncbi:MAG: phage tail length tape measure family protein [Sphingomonas phyllosphaerae]|uniref:phage tail length tape measure family protein n=1 Tax=Sphingomonas phyllosphaerae TaxID=257003 RepID=UPI002FFB95B3